jgi:hypothetical protein
MIIIYALRSGGRKTRGRFGTKLPHRSSTPGTTPPSEPALSGEYLSLSTLATIDIITSDSSSSSSSSSPSSSDSASASAPTSSASASTSSASTRPVVDTRQKNFRAGLSCLIRCNVRLVPVSHRHHYNASSLDFHAGSCIDAIAPGNYRNDFLLVGLAPNANARAAYLSSVTRRSRQLRME